MADRLASTEPLKISREVMRTHCSIAAEIEKERFDALDRAGFRVDREAVLVDLVLLRGGGYYIDVGTSARIANGEIKVKSGDKIRRFVENGLEFESGEVLDADVVVLATGYQRDPRIQAATIVGQNVAKSIKISQGLDEDGELGRNMMPVGEFAFYFISNHTNTKWDLGKALWLMGGAVSQARWNSRFIALQIQVELMGNPFPDCRWEGDGAGYTNEVKL